MIEKLWEKIKGWFTPRKEEPIILSEPKLPPKTDITIILSLIFSFFL